MFIQEPWLMRIRRRNLTGVSGGRIYIPGCSFEKWELERPWPVKLVVYRLSADRFWFHYN